MIGVYDSGIGGLSVWRELYRLMPGEDYVYLADSAYCPYGEKPQDLIIERSKKIVQYLIDKGVELVVVACNTATAAAIDFLRDKFNIPFVGMEPAVKPAASLSKTGIIGVLATANTFKGSLYQGTMHKYASDIKVVEKVGWGLVEAVEKGEVPIDLIKKYVGEILSEGADVIVLGCTHYPFLQKEISELAGPSVTIINPAHAIALQTQRLVKNHRPDTDAARQKFISTGDITVLRRKVRSILPFIKDERFETIKI